MDRAKGTVVAGLYDELMVEILSRVPVKDLRRSMCVSKPWRDLITDPLNRKTLPQTLEGFFHGSPGGRRNYEHFTSLLGSGECVDPSFSFLTAKLPGVKRMVLLDSCNGLLLFGCTREDKFGYIVCNPATEELVTVPVISASCPPEEDYYDDEDEEHFYYDEEDEEKKFAHTILMFDPAVSSHFHLVQIWENASIVEVEAVHSYSSQTRAWTDRSNMWKRGENGGEWGLWGQAIVKFHCGRALIDGLLHFVVYHVEKYENLIVAVDGEGKTCRIIGCHGKHASEVSTFIGQSQGHLHCVSMNRQSQEGSHMHYFSQLSVWVLEDYDTQEWILKHNVSTLQLFGLPSCPIDDFDVVAFHPDHNSIILVQGSTQKLVLCNMDSKELRALCTLGKGYLFLTPYVPCFRELLVLATKD